MFGSHAGTARRKVKVWGDAPKELFEVMLSNTSGNAILQNRKCNFVMDL